MHEHRPRNPAAALGGNRILQGNVVGDDNDLDRDPFGPRQLRRQSEIQPVAGIVLDDDQRTGRAGRGPDAGENRIGARRSEDIARHCDRQHARTDITGMGRLVSAATARKHCNLALFRLRQAGPYDHVLILKQNGFGAERYDALQHVPDNGGWIVDELLHALLLDAVPQLAGGTGICSSWKTQMPFEN